MAFSELAQPSRRARFSELARGAFITCLGEERPNEERFVGSLLPMARCPREPDALELENDSVALRVDANREFGDGRGVVGAAR